MKIDFNITGTMQVPDDAIFHYDVAGKLYALEFNDILYMLQICVVGEGGAGGIDILTDPQELENHSIKNIRYIDADFLANVPQNDII